MGKDMRNNGEKIGVIFFNKLDASNQKRMKNYALYLKYWNEEIKNLNMENRDVNEDLTTKYVFSWN